MARRLPVSCLLCVLLACVAQCQPGELPARAQLRRDNIPYVRCQLCKLIAKQALSQSQALLATSTPAHKITELEIIEGIERMTTAWRDEGAWLQKIDWKVKKDRLVLEEKNEDGKCDVACKTLEKAAFDLVDELDTDLAEKLYAHKLELPALRRWLCHEATDACSSPAPRVPHGYDPGTGFVPKPDNHQDMDRMLGEMRDNGMRGQIYSREELMKQYQELGAEDLDLVDPSLENRAEL